MILAVCVILLKTLSVAQQFYWNIALLQKLPDSSKNVNLLVLDNPINFYSLVQNSSILPLSGFEDVST